MYYPAHLDLSGKLCVVVGGGRVGERKVMGLLDANAMVRVVSMTLTPALEHLADEDRFETILAPYESVHLRGAWLVFAATNSREVNARITSDARVHNLLINVADSPETTNFIVPSTVRRGDLCIGISTGGHAPTLAARLSDELENRFGTEYGSLLELLGEMRDYIRQEIEVSELRREAMHRLVDAEADLRSLLRDGRQDEANHLAQTIVRERLRPAS